MNKTYCIILLTILLAVVSCTDQCNIAGNSTVASLDGRMLYLRTSQDGYTTASLDSCEVIHGRFSFFSNVDSVVVAQLYMGEESIMPVVLENGDLNVEVDHVWQRISGGPLNDRLYKFMQKKNRIENQQWELDQKCMRMIHAGHSPESNFIKDNYNNPLGPGCFIWLFSQYPYPVITKQINDIIKNAPSSFINEPCIQGYLRRAMRNPKSIPCATLFPNN